VTEVRHGEQLTWRKSRRSNASGNCVEVARLPEGAGVAIRNSRNPEGPALVFTADEIAAFVAGVRDGDFDDLVAGQRELAGRDSTAPTRIQPDR